MTLAELGVLLRGERVRCGYSVDEVASRLKITSRVVRSIEEGDLDGLPHAVYASGFIRAYATLVGLGEDEIRSALLELVPHDESAHQVPIVSPRASSLNVKWLLPVVVLLLLGGGGYVVYATGAVSSLMELTGLWGKGAMQATPDTSRPESAPAAPKPSAPQNGGPAVSNPGAKPASPTPSGGTSGGAPISQGAATAPVAQSSVGISTSASAGVVSSASTADVQSKPLSATGAATQPSRTSEADPVRTTGFAPVPAASAATGTTSTGALTLQSGAAPAKVERAGQGKNQVILTALEECWVHSSADGTDVRQFSINKGDVFALSFSNKLVLKLGNAGGVQIMYNGQLLPAAGTSGQVKTVTLPPVS